MTTEFIESHINRSNRNLLLIGMVLTIIGGGLAALSWVPALIAVPGLIALGLWLMRMINPSAHPIYKRLSHYGDCRELAQQVNREFAEVNSGQATHYGANWLAQVETYGVSLVPWTDIAWLHIYTKTQGGVPTSCYVRVWSRDGKQFVAPAGVRPGEVEQLFEEMRARAPWAEVGYSNDLLQEWNKRRTDFVTRVDERRSRYRTAVSSKTAPGYSQI